jgi:DNA mismatch endonuclease, patch repair protein
VADRISKVHRSWNMGRIKSRDTAPEIVVRSHLHRLGLRFRLHDRKLKGRPDVVLKRWNTVVFVHGCFWHRHQRCQFAYMPKSRLDFWTAKFGENVGRDQRNRRALRSAGWRVVIIWECETRDQRKLAAKLRRTFSLD